MERKLLSNMGWRGICVIAVICNAIMGGCQGQKEDAVPVLGPQITGVGVSQVSYHEATLTAQIANLCGDVTCGFEYSEDSSGEMVARTAIPSSESIISIKLKNLEDDHDYTARAFVDNGRSLRIFSNEIKFRTVRVPGPSETIVFQDPILKKWLVQRYDANGDGEISYSEALTVDRIELITDDISSLGGIEYLSNLKHLDAYGTHDWHTQFNGRLTEIDLSRNRKLEYLKVIANDLTSIDLSELTEMDYLEVGFNPLKEVSFSTMKKVKLIACSHTQIKECDLTGLDALEEIHLDNNSKLESISLDNKKLRYLDASYCALKSLDISNCPTLNELYLTDNPELKTLYMGKDQQIGILGKPAQTQIVYVDE